MRPAPRHLLLALARRLVEEDGRLPAKHRARIERALAEDATAWQGARASAAAWKGMPALDALAHAYGTGARVSRGSRAAALAEWPYAQGRTPARARARAWLEAGRSHRPQAHLVSFSGLDGAGILAAAGERLAEAVDRARTTVAAIQTKTKPSQRISPVA